MTYFSMFNINDTKMNAFNEGVDDDEKIDMTNVNAYLLSLCNQHQSPFDAMTNFQYTNELCDLFDIEMSINMSMITNVRNNIVEHAINNNFVIDVDDNARHYMMTSFEYKNIANEICDKRSKIKNKQYALNDIENVKLNAFREIEHDIYDKMIESRQNAMNARKRKLIRNVAS